MSSTYSFASPKGPLEGDFLPAKEHAVDFIDGNRNGLAKLSGPGEAEFFPSRDAYCDGIDLVMSQLENLDGFHV